MIAMPGSPPYALSASYRSNRLDSILVSPVPPGAADIHGANTGKCDSEAGMGRASNWHTAATPAWSESREPEIGFWRARSAAPPAKR
jgi:hypothetical protein